MVTKSALITGITGQDGSYLAELLLGRGTRSTASSAASSTFNTERIDHIYQDPHEPSRAAVPALRRPDRRRRPGQPDARHRSPTRSTTSARRATSRSPSRCRSTPATSPGSARCGCSRRSALAARHAASTRPRPRRCSARRRRRRTSDAVPPALARTASPRSTRYWVTVNYREAYGMFAVNGILFNHESPAPRRDLRDPQDHPRRRPDQGRAAGRLYLGNLDAARDWGYAPEYVEGMWRMLQARRADDYVLATGVGAHRSASSSRRVRPRRPRLGEHVRHDARLRPPAEVDALIGDASKAAAQLGWKATDHWRELARIMVDADVAARAGPTGGRQVRIDR